MTKNELLGGTARCIISPPKGIFLIGYGDRTKGNIGVHDDLTATTLVLSDGSSHLAIIALDLLTINEFTVDRIRERISPIDVLLCCSHTHSGPIAFADKKSPPKDQAYITMLVDLIVATVKEASSNLTSVHLEYTAGEADIAINRREKQPDGHFEIGRNLEGVVDRSVQVISVMRDGGRIFGSKEQDQKGKRLATIVNYACHGTVLGPDNLLVSADWIGAMRNEVEKELGGYTLFLQGATANLNPDMYWNNERSFEMMSEQGHRVAVSVLEAIRDGHQFYMEEGVPLCIARHEAWMPTETAATTNLPPKNYAKPLLALAKMPLFMAVFTDLILNRRYPWKPRIAAHDGFWSVPMRVNVVRLGGLALVTFAAETFTEIGMQVKADSPARQTLFTSITDGCISYLHTVESHQEGGYEVDVAPLAYRYPGRLQARCEQIALDITHQMLIELWKDYKPSTSSP